VTMNVKTVSPQRRGSAGSTRNSGDSRTLDRRTLLVAAGSSVAAGLGVPSPAPADAAPVPPHRPPRIDAYSHISSLKFLAALEQQQGTPAAISTAIRRKPSLTDLKARINLLDRNEVDIHVLVPVPWLEAFPRVATDRTLAPQMARLMNDELAAFIANEPKRFRGVALLACVDPDAMVEELHRTVKELGFLGAMVAVGPT